MEEVQFESPLQTAVSSAVCEGRVEPAFSEQQFRARLNEIKENIRATHGNNIPEQFKDLWDCAPELIALHSMFHQIIKAVPLVILSSSLDVDAVVETTLGGVQLVTALTPAMMGRVARKPFFTNCPNLLSKAKALAQACGCESGCPRCLTQHGCPQQNAGLHKDAGLFLLEAISQEAHANQLGEKP